MINLRINADPSIIKRLSLRFKELERGEPVGVEVGAYGVPYARYHEFGTAWSDKMAWAFFARMREEKAPPRPSKGVMQFKRSMLRGKLLARIKPRPFIRPALKQREADITRILRLIFAEQPITREAALDRIGYLMVAQIVSNIDEKDIRGRTGYLRRQIQHRLMR